MQRASGARPLGSQGAPGADANLSSGQVTGAAQNKPCVGTLTSSAGTVAAQPSKGTGGANSVLGTRIIPGGVTAGKRFQASIGIWSNDKFFRSQHNSVNTDSLH